MTQQQITRARQEFIKLIDQRMKEWQMTGADLARHTSMPSNTISKLTTQDNRSMRLDRGVELADYFGISIDQVFGLTGKPARRLETGAQVETGERSPLERDVADLAMLLKRQAQQSQKTLQEMQAMKAELQSLRKSRRTRVQ